MPRRSPRRSTPATSRPDGDGQRHVGRRGTLAARRDGAGRTVTINGVAITIAGVNGAAAPPQPRHAVAAINAQSPRPA
jgi:hypothetical protein